ncbi:MAG TPA: DUF1361 domain-containing protein [Candidatus Saccharimonadales bacterium]
MRRLNIPLHAQFFLALLVSSLASILLFAYGAYRNHSGASSYLIVNLFLAWLPLLFAIWLKLVLRRKRWSSWEGLAASVLWLLFLPNSFYMVSDFIHLREVQSVDVLYDAVMFTSFIFVGVVLGLASLYMVHREFVRRVRWEGTTAWLAVVFLLCGFAIYLGRDLRWNSWDVLTNPGGLLFDVSDRAMHPSAYPEMFLITFVFFVLIGSLYTMAWKGVELIRSTNL